METYTIGVIGDTHGLLRAEAVQALEGSNYIIHTGDVGKPEILDSLQEIAPTIAVRGNVDYGSWAQALPLTQIVEIGKVRLYVIHDRAMMELDAASEGYQAVLSGHSHRPKINRRNGVLYLNPGSAGPRRFHLPVTLAYVQVRGQGLDARLIHLTPPK